MLYCSSHAVQQSKQVRVISVNILQNLRNKLPPHPVFAKEKLIPRQRLIRVDDPNPTGSMHGRQRPQSCARTAFLEHQVDVGG